MAAESVISIRLASGQGVYHSVKLGVTVKNKQVAQVSQSKGQAIIGSTGQGVRVATAEEITAAKAIKEFVEVDKNVSPKTKPKTS